MELVQPKDEFNRVLAFQSGWLKVYPPRKNRINTRTAAPGLCTAAFGIGAAARYAAARSAQYKTTAGNSADKRVHAVRDRSKWHRMPAHAAVQGSPVLRPGHLSPTGAEHLQDFVHGDGPLRSIGQQLPPIAVQAPLYSVPDEGLGLEHVRRAYSPPIELTKARGIYTSLPRTR